MGRNGPIGNCNFNTEYNRKKHVAQGVQPGGVKFEYKRSDILLTPAKARGTTRRQATALKLSEWWQPPKRENLSKEGGARQSRASGPVPHPEKRGYYTN